MEYLDKLGYNTYWQVLNAKDYCVPQNRERVFALSIRKDIDTKTYKFPEKKELKLRIKDITEENVDEKYYIDNEKAKKLIKTIQQCDIRLGVITGLVRDKQQSLINKKNIANTLLARDYKGFGNQAMNCVVEVKEATKKGLELNKNGTSNTITTVQKDNYVIENKICQVPGNLYPNTKNPQAGRVYDSKGISPALDTMNGGNRQPKILEPTIASSRGRNPDNPSDRTAGISTEQRLELNKNGTSNTLTTVQKDNYLVEPEFRIRKLTPLECWRLMGFDDEDFYKAKNDGLSDTQLYKQAGNSIVVNVLEGIFYNLFNKEKRMQDIDFDDNPMTEEEVISVLGNNYKKQGAELVWRCPACPGGDKSGDNLKFNKNKNVLKCFSCDYAEEITGIIARRRLRGNSDYPIEHVRKTQPAEPIYQTEDTPKEKEIKQEQLAEYYMNCHNRLMCDKQLLKLMYEKHSIMPITACNCFIGYDERKGMLVFPSRAAGKDPTNNSLIEDNGAEYREIKGKKTIRRIVGYEPKICAVDCGAFVMHGIICEGYKDAYNLIQIMKMTEPELLNCTAVFTVQNGTNSINANSCLQKVDWNRFETIGVLMDNDTAGNKATEIALELFPRMLDLRVKYISGYADVQERFCKEFGPIVDISRALSASWLESYKEDI